MSWDIDMLRVEIADLKEMGFDLDLTGFSTDDLAEMFALSDLPADDRDPDEVPEVPVEPFSTR